MFWYQGSQFFCNLPLICSEYIKGVFQGNAKGGEGDFLGFMKIGVRISSRTEPAVFRLDSAVIQDRFFKKEICDIFLNYSSVHFDSLSVFDYSNLKKELSHLIQ